MARSLSLSICGIGMLLACGGQGVTEEAHDLTQAGTTQPSADVGAPTGGVPGSGGSATSVAVIQGGSPSFVTTRSTGEGSYPSPPSYSRECLQARLAQQESNSGGAAGAAATTPVVLAGATGTNVSASDLGLGAGDLTVLVLFDQSGSMGSGWDERSKWQVANDALLNALEPVLDLLTIGTIFFPQPNDCSVAPIESDLQIDFMSGRNFRTRWEQTSESRGPDGSTPLGLAMQLADMALEKACQLGLLGRRFRVVIVTDGEPNCGVDFETLPILPAEWRRLGVETHVMGLPGSQSALDIMDRISEAGGTGKCVSLGTPQQMDSDMQELLM